ncbi:MAG: SH3 domain-containing protein [Anaerocolumna sp.]
MKNEMRVGEVSAFEVTVMEATMCTKSSVNVRKGPSIYYEKVGSLNTNNEVKITGESNGWY